MTLPFEYSVIRKPYRRSASIRVTKENQVFITVPATLRAGLVQEIIERKSDWILKRIETNLEFRQKHPPRMFVTGEPFLFLGKLFPLEITPADHDQVSFENDRILVRLREQQSHKLAKRIEHLLKENYQEEAERVFQERVVHYENLLGVRAVSVKLKSLRSRWGSCTRDGRLILNWRIIMAPLEVIDYVIVHELAHLIHLDHSPRFWKVVAAACPTFKQCRKWLNDHGETLSLD